MTLPEGTIRIKEQSKYQKKGKKWVYIGYVPKPEAKTFDLMVKKFISWILYYGRGGCISFTKEEW